MLDETPSTCLLPNGDISSGVWHRFKAGRRGKREVVQMRRLARERGKIRFVSGCIVAGTVGLAALLPSGVAYASKHAAPTDSLTVDAASNLIYGGSATIDISIEGSTSGDTANLFTYCTQNGTTWLENTSAVMGSGIKGYASSIVVDLPTAGSYAYNWTGGAASCQSELYLYMWQGSRVTGTSVIGTVQFNVAAS